ncbi:MAG: DUF6702 family protein [Bacteroidales bacterium]
MKKLFLTLILGWVSLAIVQCHPVHVSVVNITMNGPLLQIRINTFVDDWETAYFHYFGKQVQLKESDMLQSDWFNTYLHESFGISTVHGGEKMKLEKDTIYFEDLSMTIEMHATLKDKPKSLYIYNRILTDIFADQTNLLIFSSEGMETGIKFDYHKKEKELKLR